MHPLVHAYLSKFSCSFCLEVKSTVKFILRYMPICDIQQLHIYQDREQAGCGILWGEVAVHIH